MSRYTFFSSQHVLNLELSQILTRAEAREVIVRWSDRIMVGVTVFAGDTQVHELERQYAQCCLEFEAYLHAFLALGQADMHGQKQENLFENRLVDKSYHRIF